MSRLDHTEPPRFDLNVNVIPNSGEEESGIYLGDIPRYFKKRKTTILAVTMIAFIIGIIASFAYFLSSRTYTGTATAVLSYGYKGIEDGVDPQGRPLDVGKIKSSQVLTNAMNDLNLFDKGITIEDIRSNIIIQPILPEDVMTRILAYKEIATKNPSILETLSELQYNATQYVVTIRRSAKLKKLNDNQLTGLLSGILSYYSDYFIDEYGDKNLVATITDRFNPNSYDYTETIKILNVQINNMITYCDVKRRESPNFRSPNTNQTFADIIANLNLIKQTDINRISSLVLATDMTTDKDKLITMYRYGIQELEKDLVVAEENARQATAAADSYTKSKSVVMGTSDGQPLEIDQSSDVYDKFMQEALTQNQRANQLREEIKADKQRLAALGEQVLVDSNDDPDNPEHGYVKAPTIRRSNQADRDYVEESIPMIITSLRDMVRIINDTAEDYLVLEAFKDATKVVVPAHFVGTFSEYFKKMVLIIFGVTFAGFFLAFLASIWKAAFPAKKEARAEHR